VGKKFVHADSILLRYSAYCTGISGVLNLTEKVEIASQFFL
jgi:hypothetical protein